ncbi:MAG: sulfatase-like hydrolase/transferase, partial [Planctomycetaceae bacterium]
MLCSPCRPGRCSLIGLVLGVALLLLTGPVALGVPPPLNIVWIVVDDMSPHFGCYGEPLVDSPNIDRLAREGTRFTQAFTTAPVCSPCRSALITGCYQTTIGAHHHRSGRGAVKIALPSGVVPVPALFQRAGYHTALGGPLVANTPRLGKSDYNFEWNESIYHGNDWASRQPGQPFFMQVQLHGGKHREGAR